MTHTKGPWHVRSDDGSLGSIDGPNDEMIGQTFQIHPLKMDIKQYERKSNARLMAAAPDLLAALRDLANDIAERFDLESPSTNPGIKQTVEAARAAISKATGAS